MSPIRESIIQQIDDFCDATGTSRDAFCRQSLGNHKFYSRLRSGENVTLKRVEKVLAFIERESVAHDGGVDVQTRGP